MKIWYNSIEEAKQAKKKYCSIKFKNDLLNRLNLCYRYFFSFSLIDMKLFHKYKIFWITVNCNKENGDAETIKIMLKKHYHSKTYNILFNIESFTNEGRHVHVHALLFCNRLKSRNVCFKSIQTEFYIRKKCDKTIKKYINFNSIHSEPKNGININYKKTKSKCIVKLELRKQETVIDKIRYILGLKQEKKKKHVIKDKIWRKINNIQDYYINFRNNDKLSSQIKNKNRAQNILDNDNILFKNIKNLITYLQLEDKKRKQYHTENELNIEFK